MIQLKRLRSAIIGSAIAASAFVLPFASAAPSLSANAADGDNYAKLLQYSLYFYDANMCGNNSDCALSWRGNCHTNDEVPGGFHDAGDHAMFGQPQGYTAATLGWAYYEFKDAFDATGQTAHLKVITDKFAKFFRDATVLNGNTVQKVLIEKGEGGTDHSYWGPPETQGDRGRMLWSTGGAANVTAEYAAALAANYVNFGNTEDLKYAKALYDFSKQNPATYSCEFYGSGESGSKDELAWAAGWLYLATKDESYLNDLKNGPLGYWVMNWENVSLGAGVMLGTITGDWSHAPELGNMSGDGYKFYDKWGSARHNATAQMCSLIAAKHGKGDASWAKGQMQYLTGDKAFANGQSYCLVCGFKPNASKNPHHRAASGTNSAAESNDGVQNKYTLVGALCGGPTDANGSYRDVRSDYVCNEVACDYNAGFVGAAAGLYSTYKTGSAESSIEGVTKVYGGGSTSNNNNNQQQNNDWNSQNQNNQQQNNDWNSQNQNNQQQNNDWNNQNQNNQQQNNDWNNWNNQGQQTWDWNNQNSNQWNGVVNNEWNNNNWDWNNQNQNNDWNNQNNQNQNNDWNNQNNNQWNGAVNNDWNNNNWDWNNQNQNNDWNNQQQNNNQNNEWNNQNNNQWNGVVNNEWNNNNWDWNNQNQNQNNDWNNWNNQGQQTWDWNNQNNNQWNGVVNNDWNNNNWDWNNQNQNNDWNNQQQNNQNQNNDWNNQNNNQWNGVANNDWNNQNQNQGNSNNSSAGSFDSSATMADDFRTGSSRYFIASDGWTNGDPFDCGWYKSQTAFRNGALELTIDRDNTGKYHYAGAEYRTNDFYGFGYYETSMQAIKNTGVNSSFFTYTGPSDNNPWDEIDIEILGKDTTKVQFNYYTNGQGNHEKMYDLGFDSSQGFHTFGFDWQRDHITWYVDGKAVYTAYDNIPQTPGKIMMNAWPGTGVDDWLGHYDGRTPLTARYQWVTYKQSSSSDNNNNWNNNQQQNNDQNQWNNNQQQNNDWNQWNNNQNQNNDWNQWNNNQNQNNDWNQWNNNQQQNNDWNQWNNNQNQNNDWNQWNNNQNQNNDWNQWNNNQNQNNDWNQWNNNNNNWWNGWN